MKNIRSYKTLSYEMFWNKNGIKIQETPEDYM